MKTLLPLGAARPPHRADARTRRRTRRLGGWAVLLGLLALAVYGLGHRGYGLFDVDEAIFTQATQELRNALPEHGAAALTMPTYNAEPRYHKPPLIYWAQAAALEVLGEGFLPGPEGWGLLAARLPSLLGALATVALLGFGVWHLTRNPRWALMSAAMLAFNLSFVVIGRAATADGLLNLTSLALLLWVLILLFPPPPAGAEVPLQARLRQTIRAQTLRRWGWVITALLGALAFLAKGPVAWGMAGLVALLVLGARPDKAAVWHVLAPVKVALLMLALLVPWGWLLVQQHGWGFFYEFFVVHNLQRFGSDLGNSQSDFWGYYLIVLLIGFFPWVALLPGAIRALLRGQTRPGIVGALAAPRPAEALPWLMLLGGALFVLIFSFSGTKLAHYVVPAYPALAVVAGWWLVQPTRRRAGPVTLAFWLLWGALLTAVLAVVPFVLEGLRGPTLSGLPALLQGWLGFAWPPRDAYAFALLQQTVAVPWLWGGAVGGVALSTALLLALLAGSPKTSRRVFAPLALSWGATLLAVALAVVPVVWGYTQAPLARIAQLLERVPPGAMVVHLGLHKPSLLLLSGQSFVKLDNPVQVPPLLDGAPELWVVTEEPDVPRLLNELRLRGGSLVDAQCTGGTCLLLLAPVRVPTP